MKAVLVIDMPKTCKGCSLYLKGEPNEWCYALKHGLDDSTKPTWCPLRSLPQKKNIDKTVDFGGYENIIQESLARGYNACLDEITGETE